MGWGGGGGGGGGGIFSLLSPRPVLPSSFSVPGLWHMHAGIHVLYIVYISSWDTVINVSKITTFLLNMLVSERLPLSALGFTLLLQLRDA